jgi:hypothetical protein
MLSVLSIALPAVVGVVLILMAIGIIWWLSKRSSRVHGR